MTKNKTPYRAPNFTYKEVETLIYHLELKPELIKPAVKLNRDDGSADSHGILTINDKLKLWEEVAQDINKVGESHLTGIIRSATDVKRKWNDLKSRVKHKAEDIRQGKLSSDKTPLSHLEERVLYLIAKTSYLQGLNGALPPAYLNVIGRRKRGKTSSSSAVPTQHEDAEESNTSVVASNYEDETDDIIIKQEISEMEQQELPPPTRRATTGVPIITFTTPFSKIIQTESNVKTCKNLGADSNSKENAEIANKDSKDADTQEVLEMVYSLQNELKSELKSIKKIMLRISEQKRQRIEQENEKIQLKKMKLMLKCQKQGIDYDEFITDFM